MLKTHQVTGPTPVVSKDTGKGRELVADINGQVSTINQQGKREQLNIKAETAYAAIIDCCLNPIHRKLYLGLVFSGVPDIRKYHRWSIPSPSSRKSGLMHMKNSPLGPECNTMDGL